MKQYDIAVIGAGVVGCAVARELSRYRLGIVVIDRESDVCEGTSKANSAIIHGGFDAATGTLKAKLNVCGNALMDTLAKELDIPFLRCGAMVTCREEKYIPKLEELLHRGETNGVSGLKKLSMKIDKNIFEIRAEKIIMCLKKKFENIKYVINCNEIEYLTELLINYSDSVLKQIDLNLIFVIV